MNHFKLHILSFMTVLFAAVSCTHGIEQLPSQEDYIVLNFCTSDVLMKGPIADNEYESYMSHLDVIIYEYENTQYTPFHHERIYVSDTPTGQVSIQKTKKHFKENTQYKFYIIANTTLDQSRFYNEGQLLPHADFLNLDQTDNLIHLSGVDHEIMNPHYPQMFLMDGVAYLGDTEPSTAGHVIINDPETEEDVTLNVILRRAAAKILITIIPGENVIFSKELIAKSNGYLIRNMPMRSTLVKSGGSNGYPLTNGDKNPYWESTTISQSPYFNMVEIEDKNGNPTNAIKLTAYCYSHKWDPSDVFIKGTSVVMMLPIEYKESESAKPVQYINNYYQISITKNQEIKRNTVYDLRINLNAPGAEDITVPEKVEDIQYFTAPWETVDLDMSGESTIKYLKVNKEKIYMYNISDDNSSLYFSSSSPVTVELVANSAFYYNKYNQPITLKNNEVNIYASTESESVSGNISVHSDIPTNNTIRYFQLKVTNEDGLSEIVNVEQYPLIYITNNLPWYSYREDYYYRTTGGHQWTGNTSSSTTTGDSPTTYQYDGDHIASIYTINDVDVDTKTVKYTYSSAAASSSNGGTGWTVSKVRGNKQTNSENYAIQYYYFEYKGRKWSKKESNCENHNVRNYHVRMMASSKDYTVGRPALDEMGYTSGDVENSKLVSPSFVIASRLGAVLSTYSGLSSMSNDKKLIVFADHCKNYVEVDDLNDDKKDPVVVHDNWRLPTEAELKIIIDIQGESGQNAAAIDFLLNGGYYMSASGPVYNKKNSDSTEELGDPMQATGVAIRCVRDAF